MVGRSRNGVVLYDARASLPSGLGPDLRGADQRLPGEAQKRGSPGTILEPSAICRIGHVYTLSHGTRSHSPVRRVGGVAAEVPGVRRAPAGDLGLGGARRP